MQCDHAAVTTPFCPICGTGVTTDAGLLAYLRRMQARQEIDLAKIEQHLAEGGPSYGRERRLENRKRAVAKWRAWVDWVEARRMAK